MTQIGNKFLWGMEKYTTKKRNILQKGIGIDVGCEKENGIHCGS